MIEVSLLLASYLLLELGCWVAQSVHACMCRKQIVMPLTVLYYREAGLDKKIPNMVSNFVVN